MSSIEQKCIAINNNGMNCSRKSVTKENYCTQHYKKLIEVNDITYKTRIVRKGNWRDNLLNKLDNDKKDIKNDEQTIEMEKNIENDELPIETEKDMEEKKFLLELTSDHIKKLKNIDELKNLRIRLKLLKKYDKSKFNNLDKSLRDKIKRLEQKILDPDILLYENQICPYTKNRNLCKNECYIICFYHSFAYHPKAIYWSSKNILKPREVHKASGKEFWFNCIGCEHTFNVSLRNIQGGSFSQKYPRRKLVSVLYIQKNM
jgi:hypothetical protein